MERRAQRRAPPALRRAALPKLHLCFSTHPVSAAQVLFQDGRFQWDRLENLLRLAKEGTGGPSGAAGAAAAAGAGGLDLSTTVTDGARVVLLDDELRRQLLRAFTEDDRLHVDEVARLLRLVQVRRRASARAGCSGGARCRCGGGGGGGRQLLRACCATGILSTLTAPAEPAAPPNPPPQGDIDLPRVVQSGVSQLPTLARQLALGWSDRVLAS